MESGQGSFTKHCPAQRDPRKVSRFPEESITFRLIYCNTNPIIAAHHDDTVVKFFEASDNGGRGCLKVLKPKLCEEPEGLKAVSCASPGNEISLVIFTQSKGLRFKV